MALEQDLLDQSLGVTLDLIGIPTTYTPNGGAPASPLGIFDGEYVDVEPKDALAGISSSKPRVFYRLSDLPSDPDIDRPLITINGRNYRVSESRKDGRGGVALILHETA